MTETQPGPLASPPGHPDLDTLADFGAGVLDPAESTQLRAHVNTCARCQGVLAGSDAVPDLLRTLPPVPMPAAVEARIFAALDAERAARGSHANGGSAAPVLNLDAARERRRARTRVLSKVAAGLVLVVGLGAGAFALTSNGPGSSTGGSGSNAAAGPEKHTTDVGPAAQLPDYTRETITQSSLLTAILNGKKGPLSPSSVDTSRLTGCEQGVAGAVPGVVGNPAGVLHIRFEGAPAYLLIYTANGHRTAVVVADTCTQTDPQVLFTKSV
jgi:hypothetical protein